MPEGKIFIPGVVAHKTTTIEPPELVADRILTYARIMGRENVIAGTDCGYGNRVYPDLPVCAWACGPPWLIVLSSTTKQPPVGWPGAVWWSSGYGKATGPLIIYSAQENHRIRELQG